MDTISLDLLAQACDGIIALTSSFQIRLGFPPYEETFSVIFCNQLDSFPDKHFAFGIIQ